MESIIVFLSSERTHEKVTIAQLKNVWTLGAYLQ